MDVRPSRWFVPGALVAWLTLALWIGAAGALVGLRPPWPQAILISLTLLTLLSLYRVASIHSWAMRVDPVPSSLSI
jgi:hypothetical protein